MNLQIVGIIIAFLLVSIFFLILSIHRANKEYRRIRGIRKYKIKSSKGEYIVYRRLNQELICYGCGGMFLPMFSLKFAKKGEHFGVVWQCNSCGGQILVTLIS